MQDPEIYRDASAKFMAQAHTELEAGDLAQASEKGWAAAAQMTKAIAAQRGWPHNTHAHLFHAVNALTLETGDGSIDASFSIANGLHINFYENIRPAQSVARALDDVARLLDKLRPILESGEAGGEA